jgi:DNA-binding MarR family transcriptional regulator
MRDKQNQLGFLLGRVGRAHHKLMRQSLGDSGLHRGQPPVLFTLSEQDGRTNSELAALLEVTPATTTNMVKRMEQAGFVTRRRDAEDERVSRVYLTDAGRAVLAEMEAVIHQTETIMFDGFALEERVLLRRLLTHVYDNLQEAISQGK